MQLILGQESNEHSRLRQTVRILLADFRMPFRGLPAKGIRIPGLVQHRDYAIGLSVYLNDSRRMHSLTHLCHDKK